MKIPRPEELHPPLRDALKIDLGLSLSLAPLTARAAVLRAQEREDTSATNDPAEENRIRALTGEPLLATATEKPELEEVLISIQDRKNARGRQAGTIQKERAVASRMVCEAVRPEVTRLGKKFALAMLALHAAHSEYIKFLDAVEDTGTSISSLGRVWPSGLGHFADRSGTYHYAFAEFLDAGLIDAGSIPEAVR